MSLSTPPLPGPFTFSPVEHGHHVYEDEWDTRGEGFADSLRGSDTKPYICTGKLGSPFFQGGVWGEGTVTKEVRLLSCCCCCCCCCCCLCLLCRIFFAPWLLLLLFLLIAACRRRLYSYRYALRSFGCTMGSLWSTEGSEKKTDDNKSVMAKTVLCTNLSCWPSPHGAARS